MTSEELRLECLKLAISFGDDFEAAPIVACADTFLAFVTGSQAAKVEGGEMSASHGVTLTADAPSATAMLECVRALLEHAPEGSIDLVDCTPEVTVVDLEDGNFGAGAASALRLRFEPTDRIRDLVATVLAGKLNGDVVAIDCHGWPILSAGLDNRRMTEAGGVRNASSRGLA